jgi:hypothetical protein
MQPVRPKMFPIRSCLETVCPPCVRARILLCFLQVKVKMGPLGLVVGSELPICPAVSSSGPLFCPQWWQAGLLMLGFPLHGCDSDRMTEVGRPGPYQAWG